MLKNNIKIYLFFTLGVIISLYFIDNLFFCDEIIYYSKDDYTMQVKIVDKLFLINAVKPFKEQQYYTFSPEDFSIYMDLIIKKGMYTEQELNQLKLFLDKNNPIFFELQFLYQNNYDFFICRLQQPLISDKVPLTQLEQVIFDLIYESIFILSFQIIGDICNIIIDFLFD